LHLRQHAIRRDYDQDSSSEATPLDYHLRPLSRFINLGCGSEPKDLISKLPNTNFFGLRRAVFLRRNLATAATASERVAENMRTGVNPGIVEYKRFSADTPGIIDIEMDDYKKLAKIRALTEAYLRVPKVQEDLREVGEAIAKDYIQKHRETTRPHHPKYEAAPSAETQADRYPIV
jgi:hypothetical protein